MSYNKNKTRGDVPNSAPLLIIFRKRRVWTEISHAFISQTRTSNVSNLLAHLHKRQNDWLLLIWLVNKCPMQMKLQLFCVSWAPPIRRDTTQPCQYNHHTHGRNWNKSGNKCQHCISTSHELVLFFPFKKNVSTVPIAHLTLHHRLFHDVLQPLMVVPARLLLSLGFLYLLHLLHRLCLKRRKPHACLGDRKLWK